MCANEHSDISEIAIIHAATDSDEMRFINGQEAICSFFESFPDSEKVGQPWLFAIKMFFSTFQKSS